MEKIIGLKQSVDQPMSCVTNTPSDAAKMENGWCYRQRTSFPSNTKSFERKQITTCRTSCAGPFDLSFLLHSLHVSLFIQSPSLSSQKNPLVLYTTQSECLHLPPLSLSLSLSLSLHASSEKTTPGRERIKIKTDKMSMHLHSL